MSEASGDAMSAEGSASEGTVPGPQVDARLGKRRSTFQGETFGRECNANIPEYNTMFSKNYVRTAKYTYLTFLPKSLYEQFRCATPPPAPDASPTPRPAL